MSLRFIIPLSFTETHRQAVHQYHLAAENLPPHVWATLFEAMDLLRTAVVNLGPGQQRTFASLYHALVDLRYADAYIATLLSSQGPAQVSIPLWATIARRISQEVHASASEFKEVAKCLKHSMISRMKSSIA